MRLLISISFFLLSGIAVQAQQYYIRGEVRDDKGNPLQSHLNLAIETKHFDQWLKLFKGTVDEHFIGEKAEETKIRAQAIAGVFQHKMGLMKPELREVKHS